MFRSAYSGLVDRRFRVTLDFDGEVSRTEQHHKTECDINVLLGRYKRTGQLPANTRIGEFMNVQSMEFQEAMQIAATGRQAFESLPSAIRNRFSNDPVQFLAFVHDPASTDELVKMGLAEAPPAPPEAPSPAVPAEGGV